MTFNQILDAQMLDEQIEEAVTECSRKMSRENQDRYARLAEIKKEEAKFN